MKSSLVVMEKKGIHNSYIDIIKDIYEGVVTSVRTVVGDTKSFPQRYQKQIVKWKGYQGVV